MRADSFTKTIDDTTMKADTITSRHYNISSDSGRLITLMNDYGNLATGRPEVLDLSFLRT